MRNAFPLINRPDKQSGVTRWGNRLGTAVAWFVWLYLWLPAVTLVAWALGLELTRRTLLTDADRFYLETLSHYGAWVASLTIVFLLWSAYNTHRFSGRSRRGPLPIVDVKQVAADLTLSTEAVASIMGSRKVTIEFDAAGQPVGALVKVRGEDRVLVVH